jgi:hypothetical protein
MYAFILLVASQAPPTGPATSLEDVKFFAHHDHDEVAWRARLAGLFHFYVMGALARREKTDEDYYRASRDQFRIRGAWDELETATDPQKRPRDRLGALDRLQRHLGEDAYRRGDMPHPYPPKYDKDFRAWLHEKADDPKAGPRYRKVLDELEKRQAKGKRDQKK